MFDKKWFKKHQKALLFWLNFKVFRIYPFRYFFRNSHIKKYKDKVLEFGPSYFQGDVYFKDEIGYQKLYAHSGNIHARVFEKLGYPFKGYWYKLIGKNDYQGWVKQPLIPVGLTSSTFNPANGATEPVDGGVQKNDTNNWTTTRDATTGQAGSATGNDQWVSAGTSGVPAFFVGRIITCFDTSSLPDTDTISATTLALKCNAIGSDTDNDYIVAVEYTGSTSAINTASYNDFQGLTGDMTELSDQIDLTGIGAGDTETWTLNATGRGKVNKTGITKLGLVNGADANGSGGANQPTGDNARNFFLTDHGSEPAPLLTVTHAASTAIKSINGLVYANVKSINGLAKASVKSLNGLE